MYCMCGLSTINNFKTYRMEIFRQTKFYDRWFTKCEGFNLKNLKIIYCKKYFYKSKSDDFCKNKVEYKDVQLLEYFTDSPKPMGHMHGYHKY